MSYWQGLGAFCYTGENLTDEHLNEFQAAGGTWICLLLLGDDVVVPANTELMADIKGRCIKRNIALWGWYNYWGENPTLWAGEIAKIHERAKLGNAILDCESAVQGNTKMSEVAIEVYKHLGPGFGVSTNSLNDSVVYNGRMDNLPPALWQSFRQLGIRVLPQWYMSPHYTDCWDDPVCNMQWLSGPNGQLDNLRDERAKNHRAVPTSYVHPTGERTGVEEASFAHFLDRCHIAQAHGLTRGISMYPIEDGNPADFALARATRGTLYV